MRALLLLVLLGLLTSCGFQLRGQAELPPEMARTYIDAPQRSGATPSELTPILSRILQANGVTVVDTPEPGAARLEILSEIGRTRTLASDERGDFRETLLIYEVDYQVRTADGELLINRDRVTLTRDILYSQREVLGRQEGEQLALREMRDDIAYSIVRRIQALYRSA